MITELITTAIVTIAGGVAVSYIWEKGIRDRVYVRRITSENDPDIEALLELYLRLFPDDGVNYTGEDILEFFTSQSEFSKNRHIVAENFILIARFKSEVAGFLFCHFYPERNKAIVSYYGVNKDIVEAKRTAASLLLKKLHALLSARDCEFIFFDALRPSTDQTRDENHERKARLVLLKQSAQRLGLRAYELQFEYKSPKITLAEGTHEDSLRLMVVPLSGEHSNVFAKPEVIEFVRFVFCDCYGDIYRTDDPRFAEYQAYLGQKVQEYEQQLADQVNAI